MKLSAPIHVLKAQAKALKREQSLTMIAALDLVAAREGYSSWSLLHTKNSDPFPTKYDELLGFFNEGDLVVIGARPNMGKTSFSIGLLVQAVQRRVARNYYFTLAEVHRDVAGRIANYDESIGENNDFLELDYSNDISADYIIAKAEKNISKGSLIVVDYLQLLDEKRVNPPLQDQIEKLKRFAKEKSCIIIFISQIKREVEGLRDSRPTLKDIRLPNKLDLKLMNKVLLLYRARKDDSEVDVMFYRPKEHQFRVGWDSDKIKFY